MASSLSLGVLLVQICSAQVAGVADASISLEQITISFSDISTNGGFEGALPTRTFTADGNGGANIYEIPQFVATKKQFLTVTPTGSLSFRNTDEEKSRTLVTDCFVAQEQPMGGNEDLNGDGVPGFVPLMEGNPTDNFGDATAPPGQTATVTSVQGDGNFGHRLPDRSTRVTYKCKLKDPLTANDVVTSQNEIVVDYVMVPFDKISLSNVMPDPDSLLDGGASVDFFGTMSYVLGSVETGEVFLALSTDDGRVIKTSQRRSVQATPGKNFSTFITVNPLPLSGPLLLTGVLVGPNDEELARSEAVRFSILPGVCPAPSGDGALKSQDVGCPADFSIRHIEVNQVVQDHSNSIPLVQDKRTLVRVFVQDALLPDPVGSDVMVRLEGSTAGGGELANPIGSGFVESQTATALRPDADLSEARSVSGLSADFLLPREWTQVDSLTLTAVVNLDEAGAPILAENEVENNVDSKSYTFVKRGPLRVAYWANYEGTSEFINADRFARKILPLAEFSGMAYFPLFLPKSVVRISSGFDRKILQTVTILESVEVDLLVAWLAPLSDDSIGLSLFKSGRGIVVPDGASELELGVRLASHIALRYGVSAKARCSPAASVPNEAVGVDLTSSTKVATKVSTPVKTPGGFSDLRRGCFPSSKVWIYPDTYNSLFKRFAPAARAGLRAESESADEAVGQNRPEFFLVSGTVRDGSAVLDPAFVIESSTATAAKASTGAYCVEVRAHGARSASTCVELQPEGADSPFAVLLPFDNEADQIVLTSGGAELASVTASASPPALAINSPSTGATVEAEAPVTISWTASDADADSLQFIAQYSPDAGGSWLPLGVGLDERSLTFDAAQIQGGNEVLFRVLASDGFHTTSQAIGPLTVSQTPAIAVDDPVDLGTAPPGLLTEGVVPIRSVGTGPLTIESAETDNPAFRVLSNLPFSVGAGSSRNLAIGFVTSEAATETATLSLTTNAPNQPTLDLTLKVASLDPDQPSLFLDIGDDTLDFGESPIGFTATAPVTIINRGGADMTIGLLVEGEAFGRQQAAAALKPAPARQQLPTLAGGEQETISITFDPQGAGDFDGQLTIDSNDPNRPSATISLRGQGIEGPAVGAGAIVDAAQFQPTVSPGGISSIFGVNLAGEVASAETVPLPVELAGARVSVDNETAPLFFVSPNQVNFQVPFAVQAGQSAEVVVTRDGHDSPPQLVDIAGFAPAIFMNPATGEPIVIRADGSLVTAVEPAKPDDVLIIFLTGVGSLDNPPLTGDAAAASPLASATELPEVTIGGAPAQVFFAGLTPGFVGLAQINLQLPSQFPAGDRLELIVRFGESAGTPVMLPAARLP